MAQTKTTIDLGEISRKHSEFGFHVHEGYSVIRILEDISMESLESLIENVNSCIAVNSQHIILDCSYLDKLNPLWLQFIQELFCKLGEDKKLLLAINASRELLAQNKNINFLPENNFLKSWQTASDLIHATGATPTSEIDLPASFLETAVKTIEKQTGTNCSSGSPSPIASNEKLKGDVSGIINLSCDSFHGVIVLSFPVKTISRVVERLTKTSHPSIDNLVKSSVGELTNIIFTRGKKKLNEKGLSIRSAIPVVIEGTTPPKEMESFSGKGVLVKLETNFGECYVEFRMAA